jgi:hypothetical protein
MARRFGPALRSQLLAAQAWEAANPTTRLDWIQMYARPEGLTDGHDIVTAKYEQARAIFLRTPEYDAMVCIEDDMIVPIDVFDRLTALVRDGADIGYGLYVFRHGLYPRKHRHWSAFTRLETDDAQSIAEDPARATAAFQAGEVVPVAGVGLGCTIITGEVLATISFQRRGPGCNDWYLALDAAKFGFDQRCDMGLVCGHMTLHPSPRILWPDPDAEYMRRVELI